MVSSVDVRTQIEKCTTDKVKSVYYAKIDGRVFISRSGHCFFYRKCDLVNAIKQGRMHVTIDQLVENHLEFFGEEKTWKRRKELRQRYWNTFMGTKDARCQIYKIDLP